MDEGSMSNMPEYADSNPLSSILKPNPEVQMPETCSTDAVLATNDQKMEAELLETEICNGGKHEKQENHIDMDKLTSPKCMEEVCTIVTTGTQLLEKETELYTDKSITEFLLPELVCFKESSYHVVKDICVDEGVPRRDKVLVEDSTTFQEGFAGGLFSNKDDYNDLSIVVGSLNAFDGKLTPEDKLATEEFCDRTVNEDAISSDEKNRTGNAISEEAMAEVLPTMQELETENGLSYSITYGGTGEQQLFTQTANDEANLITSVEQSVVDESCTHSSDTNENPADHQTALDVIISGFESSSPKTSGRGEGTENSYGQQQPLNVSSFVDELRSQSNGTNENPTDDQTAFEVIISNLESSPPETSGRGEGTENSHTQQRPFNMSSFVDESCTQRSGTNENLTDDQTALEVIISDLESSPPETSGRDEGTESTNNQQQPRQSFDMPLLEDDELFDSLTGSTRSLFIQHGLGESSFSGTRSVSGPNAYSGQIPYSGSTSLRSDSSTGSTRSFAFPVLHSEWNSSPVKMAKADRRRFRKHRGWSVSLLCCKF